MDSRLDRQQDELGEETFPSPSSAGQSAGEEAMEESMPVQFSIVKVFSATKSKDRERLGERVTTWLAANPTLQVVKTSVTQTSDRGFHCLSLVLFCVALS
jgi:hypothetical protein